MLDRWGRPTPRLGHVDRLGYLWCAACAPEMPKPTPDGYPVAITDPAAQLSEDDTCNGCGRRMGVAARRTEGAQWAR